MSAPDPNPRPGRIDDILDAVYPAFALLAGMQLDLFTPLADGPLDAERLAEILGVSADKLAPLLYALVAASLLSEQNGRFSNTPESDCFLVRGRPASVAGIHPLLADLWNAALQTAHSIRTGKPGAEHDFTAMPPDKLAAFLGGLHPEALATGKALAECFDLSACRALLDVGGGSGGLAIAAAEACPELRATVVELPAVAPFTERFLHRADLRGRVCVQPLDIVCESPEGTYDAAVLKAFLQTLTPGQVYDVLRNVHAALCPGGTVYILGSGILDDSRTAPRHAALFNIALLNLYDGGRAYTESEYRDLLIRAGFEAARNTVLPNGFRVLYARKPST